MSEQEPDPGRKQSQSFLDQARHAADTLVNEVQQRMPSEFVSQLRAGQRRIDQRIAGLQSQLGRSATRAEVERLARRVEELAAQLEELTRSAAGRAGRSTRTDRPNRGSRAASGGPSPRPRSSRASSSSAEKPGRRQSGDGTRREDGKREEGKGGAPRRSPRTRSRKPPESPAG